ncbi:sorting nexin-11-like [Corticium candelabrum]|uniref:sorting nexin-11-like n=1 Tax=Corticium candelabrum TaxID=121492 RepID=UPI002E276289|nr:sorting nexin-11-like [Corticium candelabrum]
MDEQTRVTVTNPRTQANCDKQSYTDYEITIQSDNSAFWLPQSTVRRRYSEFVWLREKLQRTGRELPDMPHKTLFRRFDNAFLESRCEGLERFLQSIIQKKVFLADRRVHLFIQSQLTTNEIDGIVSGDYRYDETLTMAQRKDRTTSTAETDHELSDELSDIEKEEQ